MFRVRDRVVRACVRAKLMRRYLWDTGLAPKFCTASAASANTNRVTEATHQENFLGFPEDKKLSM